jgi:hypothetical protein
MYAIIEQKWNVAKQLSDRFDINYFDIFIEMIEIEVNDFQKFKFLIDDAIAHQYPIVNPVLDHIIQWSRDLNRVTDPDLFSYLLNTYVSEERAEEIFEDTFGPLGQFFLKNHLEKIGFWLNE